MHIHVLTSLRVLKKKKKKQYVQLALIDSFVLTILHWVMYKEARSRSKGETRKGFTILRGPWGQHSMPAGEHKVSHEAESAIVRRTVSKCFYCDF